MFNLIPDPHSTPQGGSTPSCSCLLPKHGQKPHPTGTGLHPVLQSLSSPLHQSRHLHHVPVQYPPHPPLLFCTRNYVSGVMILHKELGLTPAALESFQVSCMLRQPASACTCHPCDVFPSYSAAPSPLLHHLHPGLPRSCLVAVSHLWVFAMLRQSNLAPHFASHFDLTRHTCSGDIFMAPSGLQILEISVIPILEVLGHPTDPVATNCLIFASSPTTSADQPLLTYVHWEHCTVVTVPILSWVLSVVLHALGFHAGLF